MFRPASAASVSAVVQPLPSRTTDHEHVGRRHRALVLPQNGLRADDVVGDDVELPAGVERKRQHRHGVAFQDPHEVGKRAGSVGKADGSSVRTGIDAGYQKEWEGLKNTNGRSKGPAVRARRERKRLSDYASTLTTTRRFCARPSRVLFGATGFDSP